MGDAVGDWSLETQNSVGKSKDLVFCHAKDTGALPVGQSPQIFIILFRAKEAR